MIDSESPDWELDSESLDNSESQSPVPSHFGAFGLNRHWDGELPGDRDGAAVPLCAAQAATGTVPVPRRHGPGASTAVELNFKLGFLAPRTSS